jgi:hypothetical protein
LGGLTCLWKRGTPFEFGLLELIGASTEFVFPLTLETLTDIVGMTFVEEDAFVF